MDAGGAADESALLRTAKSCGPDASMVGVKFADSFAGDGDNKARSPGRARSKPLTPLRAGMPGDPGATVVTNACAFYHCARGCGCNGHPAFPTPSLGERFMHNSGVSRRGNAEVYSFCRHCEERSDEPIHVAAKKEWIASLRSQ